MIRDHAMQPGERLPQEPDLIGAFGVSKGTIREALKMLETQGLIQMRTGPGGGAFITDIPAARARALVANYFFFKGLSISDIYDMRQALEPELAAELATHLGDDALAALNDAMVEYDHPPATIEEEQRQRIAELEFHERLAEFSNNPLLGFTCGFLAALLKDLAVCRRRRRRRSLTATFCSWRRSGRRRRGRPGRVGGGADIGDDIHAGPSRVFRVSAQVSPNHRQYQ